MAVYDPNPDFLRAQLESIAAQDHRDRRLICVIADTRSADLTRHLAGQAGLAAELVEPDHPLDSVRAFEAGLSRAVRQGRALADEQGQEPLIALCDQDDVWHPDRLSRGIQALRETGAELVHSDARLIDETGTLLHESLFAHERRHPDPGLRGLLYRNTITGMTSLFRLRLAELALPFPAQSGVHFYHDLWLGLLAESLGGVHLIRAPLVDYRQHGANAIGAIDRQNRRPGLARLRRVFSQEWLRREAGAYGLARYLAHEVHFRLSQAVASDLVEHGKARPAPLKPFLRKGRGAGAHLLDAARLGLGGRPGLARIAAGFAVIQSGRLAWALRRALGEGLRHQLAAFDARLYALSPGVPPHPLGLDPDHDSTAGSAAWTTRIDQRKTPAWTPEFSAERPALSVLVPTLNPTEIFAGITTALDFGLGVAAAGHPVRFIATDLPIASYEASRQMLLKRLPAASDTARAHISLHCGRHEQTLPAHADDRFLATAWWSAHVADTLIRETPFTPRTFFYLLQDFEPNFYPWGVEYADAMASYALNFEPIFNTTFLRDYFAGQGFGFAGEGALTFHPAIELERYATGQRRAPGKRRRLALYGRPEVARNMFATALEALALFLQAEAIAPEEIELVSVGLGHERIRLPDGHVLTSLGKLPLETYPDFLLGVDLGLALMYSPHPSHLPLEMAASGVRVVTNRFGPKDLSRLSGLIHSAAPEPRALAHALAEAWRASATPPDAAERRIDLTRLGQPPEAVIAQLADRLKHPAGGGA